MNDLINGAVNNESDENFSFLLSGDLCQMSSQRDFLNRRGIETRQNNVYPSLRQSDVKKALSLIWFQKAEGWWHYKDEYLKFEICTAEEYKNAF